MRMFERSAVRSTGARSRGVKVLSATALAAIATLAACRGGEGTTGVSGSSVLDVNAITASANRLGAVMSQPVLAVFAQQRSLGGITFDRGVARLPGLLSRGLPPALASATRLVPAARGGALAQLDAGTTHLAGASAPPLIPDSLLGKTLARNLLGQFRVSAGATGAPSNGVRFIISDPASGLVLGHADLTEAVSGATSTLTLDVAPTTGAVVLHDVETTTTSGTSGDGTDSFVGYATNGTDRVDYSEVEQTVNGRTASVTTISAPSASVAIVDSSIVAGLTSADVDVARLAVGSTTLRFTTNTVAATGGGYTSSDTTNVAANGAPFARIVVNGNGAVSFTGPTGAPLSPGDQAAFSAVEGVLLASAMVLLVPVTTELWLSLASSGL